MQNTKKHLPSAVSAEGVAHELSQLASALEASVLPDAKTSGLSSAEEAFNYLHSRYHTSLSEQDLQTFADLSHRYFAKVLLNRSVLQGLRSQQPTPVQVIQIDKWLGQYQELGQSVQANLPTAAWVDFCAQASDTLAAKGYLQPELILPPETKASGSVSTLSSDTTQHPACQEYDKEFYSRLHDHLWTAGSTRTGRVQETASAKGKVASTVAGAIPVVGSTAAAVIETAAATGTHRDNSTIAQWATPAEREPLARGLARALVEIRREQLPTLKESDFSFIERAQQAWREVQENDDFSWARKLALQDLDLMLGLFIQCKNQQSKEPADEKKRVKENVVILQQAFQNHLATKAQLSTLPLSEQLKTKILQTLHLSSPTKTPQDKKAEASSSPEEAKVVLPPAVCFTLPQTSATANAWEFQQAGILAAGTLKESAAQQRIGGELLTHIQTAGSLQQRADYWAERWADRLARLTSSTTTAAWADIMALWNEVSAYIAVPGQSEAQQAIWQRVSQVWPSQDAESIGQRALQQYAASIDTAAACHTLHTQVMGLIRGLAQQGQHMQATVQARQYQAIAQQAFAQAQLKYLRLQAEAKQCAAQGQLRQTRRKEWSQKLQSWQQDLAKTCGPAATEEPTSPTAADNVLPADRTPQMQGFADDLQNAWRQDETLEVLDHYYTNQHSLWEREQRRQELSSKATEMFQILKVGLTQLQRLIDIEQTQSATTYSQQQEGLLAAQQLGQVWEANYKEAMAQCRALVFSPATPNQASDGFQLPVSLTTPKPEEKSAAVNLVQRLEDELGEPPCGFTVLTANVILTNSNRPQHAAYVTAAQPHLALLITDPTLQDHPYWRAYAQLWQWHQQCQEPLGPAATSLHVWVATPGTLPQHVLMGRCEGCSQNAAAQAVKLFAEYQQQCHTHLQAASTEGVSFARSYGYRGLQALFSRPRPTLPAPGQSLSVVEVLAMPLRNFILQAGLYYGVPLTSLASSSAILDILSTQALFSPSSFAELRAALAWAETSQTSSAMRSTSPLELSQYRELQQHHQSTVQAIWRCCQIIIRKPAELSASKSPDEPVKSSSILTRFKGRSDAPKMDDRSHSQLDKKQDKAGKPSEQKGNQNQIIVRESVWRLAGEPPQNFDILWSGFEITRASLKQGAIIDENEVASALDFLVHAIVHRQQFGWTEHRQYLFDLPPACRLAYVEKLAQALPAAQQSLVTRLRHAPLPNGRRLAQEIEQREWEKSLQSLWQPAGDSATAESKTSSGATPVQIIRACQNQATLKYGLETHTLHPTIARQLFKPNGEWQDKDKDHAGNHRAYRISFSGKVQFWVKVYPEQPASEFLVTELDRRLGVYGTPHMELVKFQHGGKTSAAVITSAVSGVNLQTVVDKIPEQLQQLSLATFVSTLLRVLLTNPEDDKGDDYFLVPQADRSHKLVRIDNERAFFKPNSERQKLLFKSEHLLVKSIIYCLEQMQWQWADDAAVAAVIEDFLHLQPVALVSDLLQAADQLHDGWNLLFSEGEVTAHFNCKDPWASLPVMCIPNGLARELITRLTTMHTALRMEHNHMTGLQLLKVTQPKLAQYYVASHSSSPAAESKRRASTGTARESAADHTRVSARFERVAGHLYQKKNKKDSHSGQRSLMPNSVAMQSSLRLESPVDLATLQKVRSKQTCSAKQQLAEFEKWQKSQRLRLIDDLLARTPTVAEWQGLPLRQQHLVFTQLQTKAKDEQLSVEQKHFILKSLAAVVSETPWPQLDFSGFEDALTDTLLEPLLKAAGQQLLHLNINACNQLTDKSFKTLLAYNPHLRRLQAQQVAWTTITLTALPHLEELDLNDSAVQTLVGEAPSLRSLQLKGCWQLQNLGEIGRLQNTPFVALQLTQVDFRGCASLGQLCISKELFFDTVASQLAKTRSRSLEAITLQTKTGWFSVPKFLMELIQSRITQLDFSGVDKKLTSAQWKQLANYLVHDRLFTSLHLRYNQLGDAGVQVLAEALKTNTAITMLYLEGNQLGDAGAQALAEALKINATITTLYLEGNQLGDAGAQALAEALKINATITTLYLEGNQLGDAGAQALVEALKTNTAITVLSLEGNELGTEGQQACIPTTATRGGPPLIPAPQRELQQYHQRTAQALWQRRQVTAGHELPSGLTSEPTQRFDPLWEQFEDTRASLKQGTILDENEVASVLDFLVHAIVHRQQFGWTEHQQYLFDLPPACRLAYVEKLAQALPPAQQSLVTRLRHAPLPNGRRLAQEIEQRDWEKALQSLWQPAEGSATAESKTSSGAMPVQIIRACQNQTTLKYGLETHTLHPTIACQLFKPNGEWQDKNKQHSGNHLVYPISAGGKVQFWVKVYPEQPASEFLVTELDRRLGVEGTPHMELVKFQHGGKTSAAVITSAVSGVNLQAVVDKVPEQLQQLSLATFVSTLLRVLLTNPEDDKGDDYFLVPQADRSHKLIRIDNERAFFKPNSEQQKLLFKSEHLLVKSIIYCLEQMQWQWADDAAVAAVIEDFLHLQPVMLVSDLLQAADQLHDGWNLLFSEGEVTAHFNCKDPWASLPVMCIPNGLARELITRLTTMHTALRMEHNHMTGLQLLKVTQPKLAQYYVASHSSVSSSAQTLPTIPFRAEQKGASPAAESKRRASTGTARESAADHARVSARFMHVTGHLYQKKNLKDPQSHQRSLMPNSVAMQSSLRLESPVDLETLKKIRQKETGSAKQQLAEFEKWGKGPRSRLIDDLLAQKALAVAEWQILPLRQQHLVFTQLQTKAKDKQLSAEQQRFILKVLAIVVSETAWPQLDFNGFEDALTDVLLEPLLKAAGQQLLQLNVNGCSQLTDKSFKTLLAHNPHLRRLQAQQVVWTTITLTAFPHLEELDLNGSAVQTVVGGAPSLRNLQLEGCSKLQSLGEVGLVQNTLFYTPKLTQLTLTGCQRLTQLCLLEGLFFNTVAPQLPQILSTALKAITLQTETGWLSVPNFLMELLRSGITQLNFSGDDKKLTPAQWKQLINYLVHDRFFTSLNLWYNQLNFVGAQALAEALKTNTTLTMLNLSSNQLGEAGAQALAEALKTNTTLTTLSLGDNQLGDAGMQALAEALKTNTALITLGLSSNKLGGASAQALAEALRTNTALSTLDLRSNKLGGAGAQALAEMLKTNTTLTTLRFEHNQLGDAGAQALAEMLKTNTTLTTVDLRYNQLGDAGRSAVNKIEEYLARNRALQEAAKATSQPIDSKSAPSSLPPQDKKETKGESKTSESSEALDLPLGNLSPVGTEKPVSELSDVVTSSATVTRRPLPSPRGKPPTPMREYKVEVETVDAPHTQFFSSSALEDEKPSAWRVEVQPAGGPPALPRSKPPTSPRRNTVGTGAESTLTSSSSSPHLPVSRERSASSSAPEDEKSSALRIEVQLAGGPPALPSSKPPASPPHRYTTGGETINTPPSPQPFAGQSALHGQFFPSSSPSSPQDEKAVMLLTEVQQALDQAHPAGVPRHANTRQAYLLQLAEYQSRPGIWNEVERDTLRELLANLQQVVAERSKQPNSPALS